MRAWLCGLVLTLGCNGGLVTADTDTDVPDDGPQAEVLGIGLSPRDPAVEVGQTVQFTVRAFYDDTSTADVTADASWATSEERVATVDAGGLVTAHAPGEASIIATDDRGVSTRTTVRVRGAADAPTEVSLTPRLVELKVGGEVELQAVATYGDGSTGNIAATCTWTSDEASIAEVELGRVTGLAEGRSTVRATCGALDAAAPVTVRPADAELELPNLTVREVDYEVFDDELWILLDVVNQGEGMSPLAFVDVFLDSDGAPDDDDDFAVTEIVDALAPGDGQTLLLVVGGVSEGEHTFWAWADADGWVEESDEDDNLEGPYAFTVEAAGQPELTVTTFDGLTDGSYTIWTIEVENTGTEVARDFFIDLWHDPPSDPAVCDTGDDFVWVRSLAPGDVYTWEPDVDDGPSSGWLSVVWADSCDDVDEADEDDNLDYALVEP